jgi:hypothetical protein
MMEELGDRAFFKHLLGPTDSPPYDRILPTTWQYLEDRFLIKPFRSAGPKRRYVLTGSGWIMGLEVTGSLGATKETAGKVMAEIKRRVEGKPDRIFVQSNVVAEGAGVTVDFVHSLLESGFMRGVFRRVGVKFRRLTQVYTIEIPINFYHEIP